MARSDPPAPSGGPPAPLGVARPHLASAQPAERRIPVSMAILTSAVRFWI